VLRCGASSPAAAAAAAAGAAVMPAGPTSDSMEASRAPASISLAPPSVDRKTLTSQVALEGGHLPTCTRQHDPDPHSAHHTPLSAMSLALWAPNAAPLVMTRKPDCHAYERRRKGRIYTWLDR
jgi:hypothetical protein